MADIYPGPHLLFVSGLWVGAMVALKGPCEPVHVDTWTKSRFLPISVNIM